MMNTIQTCDPPLLHGIPQAAAMLHGSAACPGLHGLVRFYPAQHGVLVYADISGLPSAADGCGGEIFGFHIHAGSACTGDDGDPFADAGGHLDTAHCPHPFHAGVMPRLFGNDGRAVSVFLTNRFTIGEVLGRAVIVHSSPDDLRS